MNILNKVNGKILIAVAAVFGVVCVGLIVYNFVV